MDCFLWVFLLIGAIAVLINWLGKKTTNNTSASRVSPPPYDDSYGMDPFFATMIAMEMLDEDDHSDFSSEEYDDMDYDIDYDDDDYDNSDYEQND